jgi:hypothetical protein
MEITSPRPLRFGRVFGLGCSIVFSASQLIASDLVLQKVPPLTIEQVPAYPQNLARHRLGAQVELTSQNNSGSILQVDAKLNDRNTLEAALLGDDPTVGYALPIGRTTLLVSLSAIENVDNISFLNDGARGDVTVASASAKLPPESPQWHKVSQQELTSGAVKAKIGPAEAKYVRLTFNVSEPGRVAGLGLYPTAAVSDFTMPRSNKVAMENQSKSFGLISYNVTDLHAKTRALYVSSGENLKQANNMIDDQASTSFSFAANDVAPTVVIDLGSPTSLRRISAIYSPRKATTNFYVLQTLPGVSVANSSVAENPPPTLRVSDTVQDNLQPVASITDDGSGRVAVDFPAITGRYVMVKWGATGPQDAAFSVAEIAAFGSGQSANLMAAYGSRAGTGRMSSDGKTMLDPKDDFKDIPAEGPEPPAEAPPPALPPPPPFVFVPEIVPTSPD